PRRLASRWPSARRKRELRRSCLTAAGICITDASRRWRMRLARRGWSSRDRSLRYAPCGAPVGKTKDWGRNREANGDNIEEEAGCGAVQPEGSGCGDQPRHQGGEGRQEYVVRRAGGGGRSRIGRGRLRIGQGEGSAAGNPQGH